MASLLDYYYKFIGANPSRDQPASVPDISGTSAVQQPQIADSLSVPSMDSGARVVPVNTAAVQAIQSKNAAPPATGSQGQFGRSGMTNAQFGNVIGSAITSATQNLANSPTPQIPRAQPVQQVQFQFPTVSYQQRV